MKPSSIAGSATTTPGKQVIYVDVDDEITTIIDKMNNTNARVIALVLPKRAAVFQSIVNMKLLKRRADSAKKNLVLITSEASLLPLAGMAGIHVAPTPQSKPEIPSGPLSQLAAENDEESAELDDGTDFDAGQDAATAVGALASQNAANAGRPALGGLAADDDSVIELDNTKSANPFKGKAAGSPTAKDAKQDQSKQKPDKKLKVPNFFSFRKRLLLGSLVLVLLIVGWYFAYFVMPKATVTIMTDSSDVNSNLHITLDTAASKLDTDKQVLPAQTKQEQKSNTQQVPASGQENRGSKASGSVVMSEQVCGTPTIPASIPAGTGISTGGLTFITQTTASFAYDSISGGCIHFKTSGISVVAQKGGANYNVAPSTFTVASSDGSSSAVAAASAAAMTGGTDNIVKIVQQSDIDAAKQKLTAAQDQNSIKNQLKQNLEDDDLYALPATFNVGTPNINTNTNVGDEADNVTVSEVVTYTMFGVRKDDLSKLIEASADKQIDKSKQSILQDGLDDARITVQDSGAGPQLKMDLMATSTVGPKLDIAQLKQSIAGLKSGEVENKIKSNIGVKDVEVKYSPFWVTKAPKAEKITVVFEKTGGASDTSNDGAASSDQ